MTEHGAGSTWAFEPTAEAGYGYWYHVGTGRFDEEGRALGSVRKTPYGGSRHLMICPPGVTPPGEKMPPSFPFLRYAAKIDRQGAPLGLVWHFRQLNRKGQGMPEDTGISWFDEKGRARAMMLMRLTSGFKGIVIICPPGIAPPPGPYPPTVTLPGQTGKQADEIEDDDDSDDAEI